MTIAIIDQFPVLRMGIALFLVEQFSSITVIESDSILSFHDSHPQSRPDLIIIALSQQSGLNNFQLLHLAGTWYDLRKVILYDEKTDYQRLPHYYRLGVHNYVSKQSGLREVKACIDQIISQRNWLPNNLVNHWRSLFAAGYTKPADLLTSREYQVALLLSEGHKSKWIASQLDLKPQSVSSAKKRLFRKLQVDTVLKLRELIHCI
jgi:DNA-binding NarL/FixJ family response regulator